MQLSDVCFYLTYLTLFLPEDDLIELAELLKHESSENASSIAAHDSFKRIAKENFNKPINEKIETESDNHTFKDSFEGRPWIRRVAEKMIDQQMVRLNDHRFLFPN